MHLRPTSASFRFLVRLPVPVHVGVTAAADVWSGVEATGGSEGPGVILWEFPDLLLLGLALVSRYHQGV